MTWPGLVWKNLLRRPARTLLTAAGVSLGVALIVALLSITQGVHRTAGDLIHIGRADFGVFQSDVSDLTRSLSAPGAGDELPHGARRRRDRQGQDLRGVAGPRLRLRPGRVRDAALRHGRGPAAPRADEAVVGDGSGHRLGSVVLVDRRRFPVVGIFHSGDRFVDNGVVLPLPTVQALARRPREVTTIGVTVKLGWRPQEVAAAIERRFGGVTAVTEPGRRSRWTRRAG